MVVGKIAFKFPIHTFDCQSQLLAKADDNVECIAQCTVRSMQMLTEHTLLFERTMTLLERISPRLNDRPRPPAPAPAVVRSHAAP